MASSNRLSLTRYQRGEWFGVVRNGTVVLLGPDTPHALIDTVWELLASAPEAHEVLHEVTDAFGVSLSRIPPFGIIDVKDALRVFLRGDLELLVQLPSGTEQITGRDVTTWTERRLPGVASYSLRIGEGSRPLNSSASNSSPRNSPTLDSPSLNSLPLTEGVVLLAALEVGTSESVHTVGEPQVHAAAVPAMEGAPVAGEFPAEARVSDETMIGYTEADLGMTIAPGGVGRVPDIAPPGSSVADEPAAGEFLTDGTVAEALVAEPVEEPADEPAAEESAAEPVGDGPVADQPAADEAADEQVDGPAVDASEVSVHTSTTDPVIPSLENTTNYDHLWDKTVMRNIEDAAVRLDDESDDHDAPASKTPDAPAAPAPEPENPEPVPSAPATVQSPPAVQVPATQGLIDSVPWLRSTTSSASAVSDQQPVVPSHPVATPAPQLPANWPPPPPQIPSADDDSDHDGQTIMKSSLPTDDQAGAQPANAEQLAVNGPSVLARVCPQGHANPPTYPQCSVCGVAVSGDSIHVPRPRLGRMRVSTGELIDLDQSLIIGRQPSVSRVQGGTMPRLVQVESPGGDISRSHVEVRLEGWHVMLCDLKATNGTVLIREGQAPRRLAQNEMAILLDGDIAELGDDISLRFEEIL
ncbi:FHA domain-containing protein [Paenarthrobacter sp. FR1]|uniref:FHA domain-containing protein n=1 Tax=Paenarthrobacter sp. FR1 TaxID=3439548 RepID=UPI003DA6377A